jgi:hypothetical protein
MTAKIREMKVESFTVDAIQVRPRLRPVDPAAVATLAESMKRLGQIQPITVYNPVPAAKLIENPSNLKGLLGFCLGAEVAPNTINRSACGFKSPRNHIHIFARRKISQTVGSFRGVDIS